MSWIEPGCGATGGNDFMAKALAESGIFVASIDFRMSVRSLPVQAPPCTCSAAGNGPAPLGR